MAHALHFAAAAGEAQPALPRPLVLHLPADPEHDGEAAQSAQELEPRTFEVEAIVPLRSRRSSR